MFKRLFWLMVGAGAGFGASLWAGRVVRQTAEKYSPTRVTRDVGGGIRRLGADIRGAVVEGRGAMRDRERELLESRPVP